MNPKRTTQTMNKRKYAIGSLMLAYLAMVRKSVRRVVFITNSENLCNEIAIYLKLADIEHSFENILYLMMPYTTRSSLTKHLEDILINEEKV